SLSPLVWPPALTRPLALSAAASKPHCFAMSSAVLSSARAAGRTRLSTTAAADRPTARSPVRMVGSLVFSIRRFCRLEQLDLGPPVRRVGIGTIALVSESRQFLVLALEDPGDPQVFF